tara:strand:- start:366 stop:806 length:441 start_codon:yes stop_codon:yes gene_type:complete
MADFGTAFTNEIFNEEFSKSNQIDFFFTKRTTSYTREIIQKDLSRKDQKYTDVNNFIVLNVNFENIKETDIIHVEIWGDKGYFYGGKISENKGIFPSFALKLKNDTQIFMKLTIINEDNKPLNYVNFINIPKKYQNDNNEENESEI